VRDQYYHQLNVHSVNTNNDWIGPCELISNFERRELVM